LRHAAKHDPDAYRPTSASHCFDYEHPRLIGFQHLFEACASPMGDGLAPTPRRLEDSAFHDAQSASAGHRGWREVFYSTRFQVSRASDTPVASPLTVTALSHEWGFLGPPRPCCRPLREDEGQLLRSEVPSIDKRHPRACASRYRSRMRSRDGFRFDSALDALSPRVAALRFWRPLAGHGLDPRPRTFPNRVKRRTHASLGPTPLIDFCNVTTTTREHTPRAPDPRTP